MKTILLAVASLAFVGCSSDNNSTPPKDAAVIDTPEATPDASCFDLTGVANPTHYQIINACTTSDKIFKDSHPPLLNPDGSLPPLPP